MYLLFMDESGSITIPGVGNNRSVEPKTRYFTLGGIILHASQWHAAQKALAEAKDAFGIPRNVEIKWRDVVRCAGPFTGRTETECLAFVSDLVSRLTKLEDPPAGIAVTIDKVKGQQEKPYYQDHNDTYNLALRFMLQRFANFLHFDSKHKTDKGLVVADKRTDAQDDLLRSHFDLLVAGGELYSGAMAVRAVLPRFEDRIAMQFRDRVVESLVFQRSDKSVGLQLADLVAGPIQQEVTGRGNRYATAIRPLLRKDPGGRVEGYGLVKFPS